MSDDAMERILQLVADGRLTAAEAGPILDALADRTLAAASESHSETQGSSSSGRSKASSDGSPARAIRIEVRESGRQVVNLRVPLALGRGALDRIPGLSQSLTERVREAIESGVKGSIVDVDEDDGGVRIYLE
jgi:hypothetical protein